jgi:hypothetical protein
MNTKRNILGSALALCVAAPWVARAQGAPPDASTEPSAPNVVAPAVAPRSAAAPITPPERRVTFWGAEPGRPGEETDSYLLPSLPIRFSGYAWIDVGYMELKTGKSGDYNQHANYEQGRFVLGASYRRDVGSFFAEARAQFVGFDNERTKSQYESHTQDAFIRLGGRIWDVQVGRFLAWEPYYRGNGIELFTAEENGANGPTMYRLDYALGYADEAGQAAFHLYPADWLAFELASIYGQQQSQNNLGLRPVVALRGKGLLLTGGAEYAEQQPQQSNTKAKQSERGAAGRVAYTAMGTTVGAEYAWVTVHAKALDGVVDATGTFEKSTMGAYLESELWNSVIGAGYHLTESKDRKGEKNKHHQGFVSYTYKLPVEGLSVKAVLGYARAALEDADAKASWENDMKSIRLRVRYDFR